MYSLVVVCMVQGFGHSAFAQAALSAQTCGAGIQRNKVTVFSAHQMGSCQMGASAKSSVVAPDGQSWQVSGLYLADASVLPTSTGALHIKRVLAISIQSVRFSVRVLG